MSFALMQTALLLPVELMLNRALKMDAASHSRLKALEGKTLAIEASQPEFKLFISIQNAKLSLSPLFTASPDATLSGSSTDLLKLLLQQAPVVNLAAMNIELQGSTSFVNALQNIFKDLDLDWEFHLSALIGDLPVAGISKGLKESKEFATNTAGSFKENIQEYVRYESGLLPSKAAAEIFYEEIQALSLRVDRLQAKLDLKALT